MADLASLRIAVDSREVRTARDDLIALGGSADKASGSVVRLGPSFNALKGIIATLGLGAIAADIARTNAEFQRLQAALTVATGSAGRATAAFNEIRKFAASTPYELNQSVEAFLRLKNLGLEPSMKALRSYGNTASAMGKDLMQMVEAVADATTGEFERLKEFGIKASKAGNDIAFTFQGVTTTVKNNASDIQQYLLAIGNTQFAGGMEMQMQTLGGQFSNLKDNLDAFYIAIGQAGANNALTQLMTSLSAAIVWATENIDLLTQVVGTAVTAFITYHASVMAMGVAMSAYTAYTAAATAGTAAFTAVLAANPVGAVAIGVAALAGAIFYLKNRTDELTDTTIVQSTEANNLRAATEALNNVLADSSATDAAIANSRALVGQRLQEAKAAYEAAKAEVARRNALANIPLIGGIMKLSADKAKKDMLDLRDAVMNGMLESMGLGKSSIDAMVTNVTNATTKAYSAAKKVREKNNKEAERAAKELAKSIADLNIAVMDGLHVTMRELQKTISAISETEFTEFKNQLIGGEEAEAIERYEEALRRLRDITQDISLADAFGGVGEALQGTLDYMVKLGDATMAYNAAVKNAGGDKAKLAKVDREFDQAKLVNVSQLLGSTKKLFKEQSAGFKMVEAAEKAAAALAVINTAKNVQAGAAQIFKAIPAPWAFPVVAAMLATMASLGFSGGSSAQVAPPSAEDMQASIGTGTVLGDSSAQSESISKSLEILSNNSNSDLEYSNEMVRQLRSIAFSIEKLTTQLARQFGLASAGMFSTNQLNLGQTGSAGFLGLFSSSTTKTLWDQGVEIMGGTLTRLIDAGISARVYNVTQVVKKKSGFLGIGGGTKTTYETTFGQVDAAIQQQFSMIIRDLTSTVTSLAESMGANVSDLANVILPTAKLSFKDMNGEEIEAALQAYFSQVADIIAAAAIDFPLEGFQKAGEGLFETLARISKAMSVVSVALRSVNLGQIEGPTMYLRAMQSEDMIAQFGGIEEFQSAISSFADKFLTEAERMQPIIESVRAEMDRLGFAGIATKDQFKALVQGLDLNTYAGREMFSALMAVAPAFAKAADYLGDLNSTVEQAAEGSQLARDRRALEIQIMELQGKTEEALTAKRMDALAAMDASLRPLQQMVYVLQDQAAAAEQAARATAEVISLQRRLLEEQGDTAALREQDLAALQSDEARQIQQQIWALQDARAAQEALNNSRRDAVEIDNSASEAAARAQQIAEERAGLERQILELTGQTAKIRQLELEALDPSNRALQKRIWALQAEAEAAKLLEERTTQARNNLTEAYNREAGELRNVINRFEEFGKSLRAFRAGLFSGEGATGNAYQRALGAFSDTAAAAAIGDQVALGQLQNASQAFLDASKSQARSQLDYIRDVARVAVAVDNAIAAADDAVDYAELQLEALDKSVSGLIEINKSVLTVADGISELIALISQATGVTVPAYASGGLHSGGVALVGEQGPELVNMGPSRVWNANDTRAIMQGEPDGELRREMRETKEYIRELVRINIKQERSLREIELQGENETIPNQDWGLLP